MHIYSINFIPRKFFYCIENIKNIRKKIIKNIAIIFFVVVNYYY